jgi:glucose/arabinose dehydrogenase
MTLNFHGFPAKVAVATVLSVCAIQISFAQSCPDPVAADFRIDTLANNATGDLFEGSDANGGESGNWFGVVQIAVAPNGKVFIAKMGSGQVRVYRPGVGGASTATVRAGTVPTYKNNEDGLLGIVVDRNFMTNRWIYVYHTDPNWPTAPANADTGRAQVLTRYTYDSTAAAGNQLTNPKRIFRAERMIDTRGFHAGGGLDMSSDGVLVIGTGDDTNPHQNECGNNFAPLLYNDRGCDAQKSSSNSASLRGKLLRIMPIAFPDSETPTPGLGSTYSVPPGNLWEVINQPAFNPNWNPAVDSVSRVRKEVYSMGHRNPYHPRIDTKSGWIFTGEVGLDAGSASATRGPEGREEWNLATQPGFFGHPYCVTGPAGNDPWRKYENGAWSATEYHNCNAPQNLSPNNYGIVNLPPARPALLWYSNTNTSDDGARLGLTSKETAVGGPMYRYDPALVSQIKFPPQYEGKVFFFDWANTTKSSFRVITLNPDGTIPSGAGATPQFPAATLSALPNGGYIDMRFGPHDGAMYLLRNNTGGDSYNGFNNAALYRIAYTGPINNACYTPFVTTVGPGPVSIAREAIRRTMAPSIAVINGMVTLPVGYRTATLYDLTGRKVWEHTRPKADRAEVVRINSGIANGILQARLTP